MTPESSTQQSSPAENGHTPDDLIAQMRDDEGGYSDETPSADADDDIEDDSDDDIDDDIDGEDDDDIGGHVGGIDDDDDEMAKDDAGEAFDRRESARALPGLLGALCDAPFSALAQDAVRQAANDTIRALDEQKGARRLPPSPESRITALLRAEGVVAYLLAREVHDAEPLLSDMLSNISDPAERANNEQWAASVNLGRWRAAWGDNPGSRTSAEVAAQLLAMAAKERDWVIDRCAGPIDSPRELFAQMGLSAADREDRTFTLLATAGLSRCNPNTLAAALMGLLGALNSTPEDFPRAIEHALNVGRAALPNLLAIAPAAFSIQQGRPLADNPETQAFVGQLLERFAALLSAVLSSTPDAGQPPPTPAEGADPADSDDSARPASAAA